MNEPMPDWYLVLSDVARDRSAPPHVMKAADQAIVYLDTQRPELVRLREIEQAARGLLVDVTKQPQLIDLGVADLRRALDRSAWPPADAPTVEVVARAMHDARHPDPEHDGAKCVECMGDATAALRGGGPE